MKYSVEKLHNRKCWRRGDLEAEFVVEDVKTFNTKKEIVAYFEREASAASRRGYKTKIDTRTRGTIPRLTIHTGESWIHENTGETEHELYEYRVQG